MTTITSTKLDGLVAELVIAIQRGAAEAGDLAVADLCAAALAGDANALAEINELFPAPAEPTTLRELATALADGEIELTDDLPIYGSPEITDTTEVWSWDDTHAIVGTCREDLRIVRREDV